MAALLVDYENVGTNSLAGADALDENDILEIFFSEGCCRIRRDHMESIKNSGCCFKIHKLKKRSKNGLDFYIASESGRLSMQGEQHIALISNDKGYQAIIDFFAVNKEIQGTQIIRAQSIESALGILNDNNLRRQEMNRRMALLELEIEFARMEELEVLKREIEKSILGTQYEDRAAEIIDFILPRKKDGMKLVYTGALHEFGRKDGTAIYKVLKEALGKK